MDTTELGAHLRAATDDVRIEPAFAAAVLRGARRRQTRHRITVAVTATVAVALVGGLTYATVTDSEISTNRIMAGWLDDPTKGDLAGDHTFHKAAVAEWETGKSRSPNASAGVFDDVRGDPHVYWAGNTPAGRAAVVMQQAYLHPHEDLPDTAAGTLQTLVGLVATDPVDDRVKLVGDQFQYNPREALPGSFLFGPDAAVLLVVDPGQPLWETHVAVGHQLGMAPDPALVRDRWEPIPVANGVALEHFEDGVVPADVMSGADPDADTAVRLRVLPTAKYLVAADVGGTGPLSANGTNTLDWPTGTMWAGTESEPEVDTRDLFLNGLSGEEFAAGSAWYVHARLRDGGSAVLSAAQRPGDVFRFQVVLTDSDQTTRSLTGGVVNRNEKLPVRFRLPDEKGWIVAAHGRSLQYRTDGDWRDAGEDAALLPDDATQVRVGEKVVDL